MAILLAASTQPAVAQAEGLEFSSASGAGAFTLVASQAVVQAAPAAWTIAARQAELYLVDDRSSHEVEDPLRPGNMLVSHGERVTRSIAYSSVNIRLDATPDAVALVMPLGAPLQFEADLRGAFALDQMAHATLERSHYVSSDAAFAEEVYYEISHGPSLRLASPVLAGTFEGDAQVYLWGVRVTVSSASNVDVHRTGHYRDGEAPLLSATEVSHYVHAYLNLTDARITLPPTQATLYADRLRATSGGSLSFHDATGRIPGPDGVLQVANGTVVATTGEYEMARSGSGLVANVVVVPSHVGLQGMAASPATPWSWAPLSMGLPPATLLLYLAPYLHGRLLGAGPGWRESRAEAFAYWASKADGHGRARLAAFLAGRTVRNRPKDPDARLEHAILLHQAGKVRQAAQEHEMAGLLYAFTPDSGNSSLNAYQACLAWTRLGNVPRAVAWLQKAVEGDPALASAAATNAQLVLLRKHPDFGSIVGKPGHAPRWS